MHFWLCAGVVSDPPVSYAFTQSDSYYIKFDDGLERGDLDLEEVIPAASLLPGQQVNVCLGLMEEGISHKARLGHI